jgi:hypothetical protein
MALTGVLARHKLGAAACVGAHIAPRGRRAGVADAHATFHLLDRTVPAANPAASGDAATHRGNATRSVRWNAAPNLRRERLRGAPLQEDEHRECACNRAAPADPHDKPCHAHTDKERQVLFSDGPLPPDPEPAGSHSTRSSGRPAARRTDRVRPSRHPLKSERQYFRDPVVAGGRRVDESARR